MIYGAALAAVVTVVILAALISGSAAQRRDARIQDRLAGIERRLNLIIEQQGIVLPVPEHPDVVEHLRGGRKILAVKAYRDRTGVGLAEAKEAVEQIARDENL